ncbi:molybdopterin-dependent oxidoreductase [Sphingomonas piscis]|uniref:Molybdopterin-dependent oxidoreductase n=1 Tax=Sphingomonas piscis TaxID=2714943 RepID=A0A6G7YR34_9SPHN|nr:molybdopterin-dependent oxidoreductase [Sphingomonas piscis]QIK79199.1 molybdopterin-dependent oxidoreductase [Sphingomonas piscis]
MSRLITRRALVGGMIAGGGGLLAGCDRLGQNEEFRALLGTGEKANQAVQRLLQNRTALAQEFAPSQRSPIFRPNGTRMPAGPDYAAHLANQFADWNLIVDGAVSRPRAFSLAEVKALPARTQITRHDCVEGWSAIAKWTGVPLKILLDLAGIRPEARFIVFHCADRQSNGTMWYESIDRIDAAHPQTILAWAINDQPLPVQNGAPLRMRIERQLGYKHAKYVQRIEAVTTLAHTYGGKGGYWEDVAGYEWYAGI